jgi:hypothetical protein
MVVHDHCRRGSIEGVAALRVGDVRSLSMLLIQRLPFRKLPMARARYHPFLSYYESAVHFCFGGLAQSDLPSEAA